MKSFAGLMLLAGMIVLLCGCGGGGLGSSHKIDFGKFEGYAKINASAEHPRVGIIQYENNWSTLTSSAMDRSTNGWQDVSFSNALPVFNNNGGLVIVIFNDINGDGKYDKTERMGSYGGYMSYDQSGHVWQLWRMDARANVLVSSDMRTMKGHDLYIDCSIGL